MERERKHSYWEEDECERGQPESLHYPHLSIVAGDTLQAIRHDSSRSGRGRIGLRRPIAHDE